MAASFNAKRLLFVNINDGENLPSYHHLNLFDYMIYVFRHFILIGGHNILSGCKHEIGLKLDVRQMRKEGWRESFLNLVPSSLQYSCLNVAYGGFECQMFGFGK